MTKKEYWTEERINSLEQNIIKREASLERIDKILYEGTIRRNKGAQLLADDRKLLQMLREHPELLEEDI